MLTSIKQRLGRDDEQGFTLIELMVVVLIIAILLAIAIPTFLGARNTANARGAQSNLRNGLTAEQTYWTNNQAFSVDVTATGMPAIESALNWVAAPATTVDNTTPNSVLVALDAANGGVVLTALGKDKNCYSIYAVNVSAVAPVTLTAGTQYDQTLPVLGVCSNPVVPVIPPTAGSAHSQVATWSTSF